MRSRNDHARLKSVLPHQASHARRRNHAGKRRLGSGRLQSSRQQRRNVRPRFARIHADQHARRAILLRQISAERSPGRIQRCVVERRFARFAADSVGTEKFFGHVWGPYWFSIEISTPQLRSFVSAHSEVPR